MWSNCRGLREVANTIIGRLLGGYRQRAFGLADAMVQRT